MPRDKGRKALAQGLASGSRWITRAPALAAGTGDAPSVGASTVCRARDVYSAAYHPYPDPQPAKQSSSFSAYKQRGRPRL
ncbi:hypothetical protein CB1_001603003 [Camelus ferus]|nr:hypothetical protein CB1_001603003 [Camelus ferus]